MKTENFMNDSFIKVNGDILISGSYDHNLKIWDIKTGQCKNTLKSVVYSLNICE